MPSKSSVDSISTFALVMEGTPLQENILQFFSPLSMLISRY